MTVPTAVASGRALRGRRLIALCALGTSVLADVLFHDQPIGASLAVFGIALLALVLLVRHRHRRLMPRERRLVYAMIGLVAVSLVDPGIIGAALFVLALWTVAVGAIGGWPDRVIDWLGAMLRLPQELVVRVFVDQRVLHRWRTRHARVIRIGAAVLNWSAPILMALVFVAIFWMANPVIGQWISIAYDATKEFATELFENTPVGRIGMWFVAALFALALLRGRRRAARAAPPPCLRTYADNREAIVTRSLALFNVAFAVQTTLDIFYLGAGATLPDGMTFASYAHRGAYPLIAAALLAGIFTLWAFPVGRDGGIWSRRLIVAWIVQCVVLTTCAAGRLWLYVGEYSLTRWRLATIIWLAPRIAANTMSRMKPMMRLTSVRPPTVANAR